MLKKAASTLAVAAFLTFGSMAAQAATFAWDTLTGATVNSGTGANIFGTPNNSVATALIFEANASGLVQSIDVLLSSGPGTSSGSVLFALFTDGGSVPGTLLGTGGLVTTTAAPFVPELLSVTAWNSVSLLAGQTYWLVGAAASSASTALWFGTGPEADGIRQFSTDGATWSGPRDTTVPAVRIEVEAAVVPLPTSLPLLAGGITLLGLLRRRRRRAA